MAEFSDVNAAPIAVTPTRRISGEPRRLRPIGITMGDPAGIGPELVLRVLADPPAGLAGAPLVIYGDRRWLTALARRHGLPPPELDVPVVDCAPVPADLAPGKVDPRAGNAAWLAVSTAARDAVAGRLRAIVTAPLHKAALNLAGHAWPGHTEILAAIAGNVPVRMMLANHELRTVLVSIHLPLKDAITTLDEEAIAETISLTNAFLIRAGIARPRIAVAGLNPHAGEDGLLGTEEIRIIAPAVRAACRKGIDATGPWPPDTVFMQARGFRQHDVVIAMYHDQGLIPIKYGGLDEGVNVTIGLPFVRTSPDHGTAFDIADRGVADPASMRAALRVADELSQENSHAEPGNAEPGNVEPGNAGASSGLPGSGPGIGNQQQTGRSPESGRGHDRLSQ